MKMAGKVIILICLINAGIYSTEPSSLHLQNLTGQKTGLQDYPAKITILNFWAVWCKPCVQEFPELNQIYNKFRNNGVIVLGISMSPSKEQILKFTGKHKVDFPILIDVREELSNKYSVSNLPTTILLDNQHNIIYKYQGFSKKEMSIMEELIDNYLKKNNKE